MKTTKTTKTDLPVMVFENKEAWETWLSEHFDESAGLWLRIAKKSAGAQSVSYHEALEVALCYGWIDGQKERFDQRFWMQKFTPRGPTSIWSKLNRAKALELIDQGRMQPAGLTAIENAKENGRWSTAYDSHRTAVAPDDFLKALEKNPEARAFFARLSSQNRYAILFRIQTAKKIETRQKRILRFVEMLAKHKTLYP